MAGKKILLIDTIHPVFKEMAAENNFACTDGSTWDKAKTCQQISEFDGVVIRSRFELDRELIDKGKRLEFIARFGAGMENIDVVYAEKKGIKCLNVPEGNRDAVGEHAMAMLLALFNKITKADSEVRSGIWKREENRGIELQSKTVGIIGFGNMGSAFAKKLSGFDVKVLAYDKYINIDAEKFTYVEQCTPEKIYSEADILSLHVPLTHETDNLVNDKYINRFKKDIYIINTSRGKVLSTADLVKNIKSGKVKGACLDVFDFEDFSFEKTGNTLNESFEFLKKSQQVILSPHIAGWTHESNEKMAKILVQKIISLYP